MTIKEIIDGLKFTVEMFLLDPITGETFTEPRNDLDKTTIDACKGAIELLEQTRWIPVSERLPDYGVAVLTYDGSCYSVEKRIPTIRDDDGEPISGEWWVSDDYDESNSEYYPNLRDGACIAWMPLPEPYEAESEE